MKTLAHEQCRAELLRRLATVRPESAARWGRMSSHQMLCHLGDACRVALGEKRSAVDAAIFTGSPVCGLRPVRAARLDVLNDPNPGHATLSPFFALATT